jgi:hypothetical protein
VIIDTAQIVLAALSTFSGPGFNRELPKPLL